MTDFTNAKVAAVKMAYVSKATRSGGVKMTMKQDGFAVYFTEGDYRTRSAAADKFISARREAGEQWVKQVSGFEG
jgi:hypothetical protein